MKRIALIIFIIISTTNFIFSQSSVIKGTVKDAKTGETLIGCYVIIQGTTIGSTTDMDGNYAIKNVAAGTYNLVATYISYDQKIIRVSASKGETVVVNFELEPAKVAINEVTIKARKRIDTEMSMISSIKQNYVISTGIASQQIARSQDRDASEVIRRVPGITVIEDRFVIVRGLGQRYNNVILNNAPAPSSETDSRAFSFDVIPSSMIDRLVINVTPAPDLPADFAGGAIKIFTKNVPDNDQISVSYTMGYLNGTTQNQFVKGPSGKYDFFGYDDGSRTLPSNFPKNLELIRNEHKQIDSISKLLNRSWKRDTLNAPIDNKLSLSFGKRFNIKNATLGNVTSLNFSNTYSTRVETRQYNESANVRSWLYNDSKYKNTAKVGILHNWSMVFGKNNKIEFRNLYNHIGYSQYTGRTGSDRNVEGSIKSLQLSFFERTTYSGQIGGEHQLSDNNDKVDWVAGYSNASRNEPGIRRLTTQRISDKDDFRYGKDYLYISSYPTPEYAGLLFLKSNEEIINFGSNIEHKFFIGEKFIPSIKAGFYIENKSRDYNARLLGYINNGSYELQLQPIDSIFQNKHINSNTGISVGEHTSPTDSYDAENNLAAGYIAFNIPILSKIKLYTGVRWEKNIMKVNSFSSDNINVPLSYENKSNDFFPSANITINFTDKSLVRLAYGETTNRPEFREKAPLNFYVYEQAASVRGDTTLKNAYIHNFDLRYEYYPSESEIFTLSGFYKKFINPIEMVVDTKQSNLNYSFVNAGEAVNYGVETELRKSLSFIGIPVIKDLSLTLNAALIKSDVDVVNKRDTSFNRTRLMQGQSPYIANAGLFYQNDKIQLQVSALYNIIGRRISFVGDGGATPDIYEEPRNLLDITASKKIGKYFQVKAGIQDILNNAYKNDQHFSEGNKTITTLTYKSGTYYTMALAMSF